MWKIRMSASRDWAQKKKSPFYAHKRNRTRFDRFSRSRFPSHENTDYATRMRHAYRGGCCGPTIVYFSPKLMRIIGVSRIVSYLLTLDTFIR